MRFFALLALIVSCSATPAAPPTPATRPPATTQAAGDLFIRIVDVGAGQCAVIKMPGDHYMIYDAGNYQDNGQTAIDGITALIPEGSNIDLMILSHTDADHLAAVPDICDKYHVKRIIHSGITRTTTTWSNADRAIGLERDNDGCIDSNLAVKEILPGSVFKYGDVFVQIVCGFNTPPADWDIKTEAERMNAGSISARVIYNGRSVFFTGDSVGRHIDAAASQCIAGEKFMVDNSAVIPISSDVLIAPHHGADNGSSTAFIQAVHPTFVVFTAGHKYQHPRAVTVQRYLANGVQAQNIFRTDRGDDEGPTEWDGERVAGGNDKPGDDDIDITIPATGAVQVKYRN